MPIVFARRTCKGPKMHLNSPNSELEAIIFALRIFRDYLGFDHFTLITDNTSVWALQNKQKLSKKLARWEILLSKFNFSMEHKPGSQHENTYGLS